jgi:hypothetical protein
LQSVYECTGKANTVKKVSSYNALSNIFETDYHIILKTCLQSNEYRTDSPIYYGTTMEYLKQ